MKSTKQAQYISFFFQNMVNMTKIFRKRIKNKSDTYENVSIINKKKSSSLHATISITNKMFSECFSYIRAYMESENINYKLSHLALKLIKSKTKNR